MGASTPLPEGPFRIGQVAELTGVSVNTLRTWERRYGLVSPERTRGGLRTYSAEQVERLRLVRLLTRAGGSVSLLAPLSLESLRARLVATLGPGVEPQVTAEPTPGPARPSVAIVHRTFTGVPASEGVTFFPSLGQASAAEPDVLVVEAALLGDRPVGVIASVRMSLPSTRLVVLVAIASRRQVGAMEAAGAVVIREPIRQDDLLTLVRELSRVAEDRRAREAPLLSRSTLQRLLDTQPTMVCGCPEHLARITLSVVAFEDYSRSCMDDSPEDTVLHAELADAAADIRARLEALILRVCEHDGIPVLDDQHRTDIAHV